MSCSTNEMIDKYLSNVRDISESTREDFHSSSSSLDGSNEDEKELCVYIKNYIDDRDEVGISLYTTRESRKCERIKPDLLCTQEAVNEYQGSTFNSLHNRPNDFYDKKESKYFNDPCICNDCKVTEKSVTMVL